MTEWVGVEAEVLVDLHCAQLMEVGVSHDDTGRCERDSNSCSICEGQSRNNTYPSQRSAHVDRCSHRADTADLSFMDQAGVAVPPPEALHV